MTDLEITKACAEAMGYTYMTHTEDGYLVSYEVQGRYDPLHDDAQAMALVKKFRLDISAALKDGDGWDVSCGDDTAWSGPISMASNAYLNRAICECVAKMKRAEK